MFTRNLLTNKYQTIVICLGQRSTVERTVQYIRSNGALGTRVFASACIRKYAYTTTLA